jgi:type IV secretion system protein VirD4
MKRRMQPSTYEASLPLGYSVQTMSRPVGFVHGNSPATDPDTGITLLRDASEKHAAVIAPTGAGKGRCVLVPWLLCYSGSAVVVDPKAEAAYVTAFHRCRMGQKILLFDPWEIYRPRSGDDSVVRLSFNPIRVMLRNSADLSDDCLTLVELAAGEAPKSLQDPFWRTLALDLLVALVGWVWVRAGICCISMI